jgi:Flp pilus assembly protein TadG
MVDHLARRLICNILVPALRRLRGRRGGVALIIGLSAPLLIAVTGLSVDVGFWFQNQTSLQSAADAASLAAAMNDVRLGQTTSTAKVSAASPYAQAAADAATNAQFGFAANSVGTNPRLSVTCCATVGTAVGNYTGTTTYTATVNAPRQSFLSQVAGLASGTQYAGATASMTVTTLVSGRSCLFVNPQNNITSNAITFVNDNGGGSTGGISAGNCGITVNCGTGDTAFNPPNSANSTISGQTILVANASGCSIGYSSNLYTTAYASNHNSCGSSNGFCGVQTANAVAANPLSGVGDAQGNSGTSAWQAACTAAGLTGSSSPAVNLRSKLGATWAYGGTLYAVSGICEPSSSSTANFSAGGTYFFPYGFTLSGNDAFGPGIYYFGGSGLSGGGGTTLTSNGATLVFVGSATLTVNGNGNGNNGSKVALVAPDASLGDACLPPSQYNNASTPTADATSLDGTAGGGICGVAIYQSRSDTAAMALQGDTASTVIGIIYAPRAQITLSGNGGFSAGTYASGTLSRQVGTLAVLANNLILNGNGSLTLNMNKNDSAGATTNQTTQTSSATPPMLIN